MVNLWRQEPAVITSVVAAGIDLAVLFGAPISQEQKGAIIGFVTAVLAAVTIRSQVAPASTEPAISEPVVPGRVRHSTKKHP